MGILSQRGKVQGLSLQVSPNRYSANDQNSREEDEGDEKYDH
jgi:hypothetical protein